MKKMFPHIVLLMTIVVLSDVCFAQPPQRQISTKQALSKVLFHGGVAMTSGLGSAFALFYTPQNTCNQNSCGVNPTAGILAGVALTNLYVAAAHGKIVIKNCCCSPDHTDDVSDKNK